MLVLNGLHRSFFRGGEGGGVCVHSDVCGSFHRDVSVYAWQLKITFSQSNVYRAQQNPLRLSRMCLERVSRRYAGLSRPPPSLVPVKVEELSLRFGGSFEMTE